MTETHASHMASLVLRLLNGQGEQHVPTENDLAKSKARAKLSWAEHQQLVREEVKMYSIGDRVCFVLGGPRGILLYGIVDEIHELWIGVRGDDGGAYVCPPFSGIKKINAPRL